MERKKRARWLIATLLILVVAYLAWSYFRPVKPLDPKLTNAGLATLNGQSHIAWPSQGEAAVGILGTNILDTHNPQTQVPTASTAKLITALMVLRAHPLNLGQSGPLITLGPNDVAIYDKYIAEQGSVVSVLSGEQITEYQMLQAMLLPSANNIADSLAIWAYGSLPAYSAAANTFVHDDLGLSQTEVGSDASGFLPNSVSTAGELVKLGEFAMANPVIAQIVGQTSASGIPVAGTVTNINTLLGNSGIVGIKTGNSDQAGGVFIGAAKTVVGTQPVTVITALANTPSLQAALSGSLPFIKSAETNFTPVTLVPDKTVIASYHSTWDNKSTTVVNTTPLNAYLWDNTLAAVDLSKLNPLKLPVKAGQSTGQLNVQGAGVITSNSATVAVSSSLPKPSFIWKVLHP